MLNVLKSDRLARHKDTVHMLAELYGSDAGITAVGMQRHQAQRCNQPPRPPHEMPDEYAVRVQYKVSAGVDIECVWVQVQRGGKFVWSCFYDLPGGRYDELHDESWSVYFLTARQIEDIAEVIDEYENDLGVDRLTMAGPSALPKMRTPKV